MTPTAKRIIKKSVQGKLGQKGQVGQGFVKVFSFHPYGGLCRFVALFALFALKCPFLFLLFFLFFTFF